MLGSRVHDINLALFNVVHDVPAHLDCFTISGIFPLLFEAKPDLSSL